MVSYDDAVAIIQNPDTDPMLLAKVAYENPEFGANVAAHPRAYPGLKRWLAEFGDERARRICEQMGFQAAMGPIEGQTSVVEAVEPQPASYEPQAQTRTGVDMLDEQFNNLPDESVTPENQYAAQYNNPAHAYQAEAFQQPNAYGFTAQTAATTNDPAVMQQIAQVSPELHPALARNPYLYPELRAWLGMLNNPEVNAVLAQQQQ